MATHGNSRCRGVVVAAYWIGLLAILVAPAGALAGQPAPAAGEPAAAPEQPPEPAPAAGEPAATPSQPPPPAQSPEPAPAVGEPPTSAEQPAGLQPPEDAAESGAAEGEEQGTAESAAAQSAAAEAAGEPPAAPAPPAPPAVSSPEPRRITRGEVVRVGGSVTIERDERVVGDVVVILGGLDVEGEVAGDVVVVAGSARFGPQAVAGGDVTVVGGSLRRASSAVLVGAVTEVGFGSVRGFSDAGWWQVGWPRGNWFGSRDLVGTVMRLFILGLLASGLVLVARAPVERIARRALDEPLKAGVVGMVAQMLAVPALVLGILGLVISIVGIPFLLLLPFVVMAAGLVMLVGFSGAVLGAGELARSRMGAPGAAVFASVWAGVALILLPTMAGEAVGLAGGLFGGLGLLLLLAGFLVEYAAWTAGLGALILNRFSPLSPSPGALAPNGLPAPPPPAAPVPPPPVAPSPPVPSVDPVDTGPAPDSPPPLPEDGAPRGGRD